MERERLLQQQRLTESSKLSAVNVQRDRSPLRNGADLIDPPRIKEEPKREDEIMMRAGMVTDPRYHHPSAAAAAAVHHSYMTSRHPQHILPPPPHLSRTILSHQIGGPPMPHYGSPASWASALDPYGRDPYRIDPMQLRYNPMMEAAIRAEEERAKAMNMYAAHSAAAAHMRKEPSPVPPSHLRMPTGSMKQNPSHMAVGMGGHPVTVDMHKKEDTNSSR